MGKFGGIRGWSGVERLGRPSKGAWGRKVFGAGLRN